MVLVGTLDIPSLKGLKLAVGTLELLNLPREKWRLVLNRADAEVLSRRRLEETLGLKADVSLPSSRDVLTAVNRGETIVRANLRHQVSEATVVRSLAHRGRLRAGSCSSEPVGPAPHSRRGAPRRGLRSRKVA